MAKRLLTAHECIGVIQGGGQDFPRQRDGTMHVPDDKLAASMVKVSGGDLTYAGDGLATIGVAYVCDACGFRALYSDHCGRCGGTELTREGEPEQLEPTAHEAIPTEYGACRRCGVPLRWDSAMKRWRHPEVA